MNPSIWGPPCWTFLHSVSFDYPNNPSQVEKNMYKTFFNTLQYILPCEKCRQNYKIHIQKYPIDNYLNSKDSLVNWLVKIHNEVNIVNNKRIYKTKEVIQHFKNIYKNKNNHKYIFIIAVVIIAIFLYILKYSNQFQKKS
jgi:hypothetical protein